MTKRCSVISIPGFKIHRQLSAGGFGTVHLAQRDADGLYVAVKLLHFPTDDNVRRFYREAKILHQQIGNPNVVRLLQSDFAHDPPWIAMEYCSGGSLRSWVGKNVDWLDVVSALADAAAGLALIHQSGGFHRDIKPDNLLIAEEQNGAKVIKVGDFGLARVPHITDGAMTRNPGGTEGYIAPELALGGRYDRTCDVYSLGVTGIELISGSLHSSALLKRTELPIPLRNVLLAMVRPQPLLRPDIQVCHRVLVAVGQAEHLKRARLVAQKEMVARSEPQTMHAQVRVRPTQIRAGATAAGAGFGLGLALLVGGIALATMNPRDGDGRWRGRDGRFRSGPWG